MASATIESAPLGLSGEIDRHSIAAQNRDRTWMAEQPMHIRLNHNAEATI